MVKLQVNLKEGTQVLESRRGQLSISGDVSSIEIDSDDEGEALEIEQVDVRHLVLRPIKQQ